MMMEGGRGGVAGRERRAGRRRGMMMLNGDIFIVNGWSVGGSFRLGAHWFVCDLLLLFFFVSLPGPHCLHFPALAQAHPPTRPKRWNAALFLCVCFTVMIYNGTFRRLHHHVRYLSPCFWLGLACYYHHRRGHNESCSLSSLPIQNVIQEYKHTRTQSHVLTYWCVRGRDSFSSSQWQIYQPLRSHASLSRFLVRPGSWQGAWDTLHVCMRSKVARLAPATATEAMAHLSPTYAYTNGMMKAGSQWKWETFLVVSIVVVGGWGLLSKHIE